MKKEEWSKELEPSQLLEELIDSLLTKLYNTQSTDTEVKRDVPRKSKQNLSAHKERPKQLLLVLFSCFGIPAIFLHPQISISPVIAHHRILSKCWLSLLSFLYVCDSLEIFIFMFFFWVPYLVRFVAVKKQF